MTKLAPYAGYDPNENQFDGVELAPLHDEDLSAWRAHYLSLARGARSPRLQINRTRGKELLAQGYKIAQIRFMLAAEMKRPMPFCYHAVYNALVYKR